MRRFLLPIALLLATAIPACASRQMDESNSSEAHEETSAAPEEVSGKIYEAPAVDPGKTGVASWSLYAVVVKGGVEAGFVAYGTNTDGLLVSAVVADFATGSLSVYDNTSRDATSLVPAPSELFETYAAEMEALLLAAKESRAASSANAALEPQRVVSMGDRAFACAVGSMFAVIVPGILIGTAFVLAETIPVGAAAGVAIMAGAAGMGASGVAASLINNASVTVAGVSEGMKQAAEGGIDAVNQCLTGETRR